MNSPEIMKAVRLHVRDWQERERKVDNVSTARVPAGFGGFVCVWVTAILNSLKFNNNPVTQKHVSWADVFAKHYNRCVSSRTQCKQSFAFWHMFAQSFPCKGLGGVHLLLCSVRNSCFLCARDPIFSFLTFFEGYLRIPHICGLQSRSPCDARM